MVGILFYPLLCLFCYSFFTLGEKYPISYKNILIMIPFIFLAEKTKKHNKLSPKNELELKVKTCGYTEDEQKAILNVIKLINQSYELVK